VTRRAIGYDASVSRLLANAAAYATACVAVLAGCMSDSAAGDAGPADGSVIKVTFDAPKPKVDARVVDAPITIADARIDARIGVPADAPGGDNFDVAYAQEWTIRVSTAAFTANQIAVVINTGTTTLDMSTLKVLSVTDDNGNTDFQFTIPKADPSPLAPGKVHGDVADVNVEPLIRALVPELDDPRNADGTMPVFAGGMTPHKGGSYDIHPKVKLQIGDAVAELDFLVHVTGSGTSGLEFKAAKRVSAKQLPDAGM